MSFQGVEFTPEMIAALKAGTSLLAGVEHPEYQYEMKVEENIRQSLLNDFD